MFTTLPELKKAGLYVLKIMIDSDPHIGYNRHILYMQMEGDYKEIDVFIPEAYQRPLFQDLNIDVWKSRKDSLRKAYIDPISGKVVKITQVWAFWSDEEVVYVLTHYRYFPLQYIADQLDRTLDSLKHKLAEIKKNPDKCAEYFLKLVSKR